jgi:hypothetical protein
MLDDRHKGKQEHRRAQLVKESIVIAPHVDVWCHSSKSGLNSGFFEVLVYFEVIRLSAAV